MKNIFIISLLFITNLSFSKKTAKVYNYDYTIETIDEIFEADGKVTSYINNKDTTILTVEIISRESYSFNNLSINKVEDTLKLNIKHKEDTLMTTCTCMYKVYLTIKLKKLNVKPLFYSLSIDGRNDKLLNEGELILKKIYPTSFIIIDSMKYNYSNKYGFKEGPWLISADTSIWKYSKIINYSNGEILTTESLNTFLTIKDSIILRFENMELKEKIVKENGSDIYIYYKYYGSNSFEQQVFDPRFDKLNYDNVFLSIETNSKGLKKECFNYVSDNRIVERICK